MKISKLFKFLTFFAFIIVLLSPKPAHAASTGIFSSPDSIFVKAQEGVQYFFSFKVENKVSVLEKHAEKRLVAAQGYAEEGNHERVQNMIQSYQQIKEKQNNLLGKINDGEVLGMVAERTVEQQKTMEVIKTRIDEGTKQNVIKVQEQVVNQVAKRVVEVNGPEGVNGFLNEVAHVWAPGTGPGGGEAGHVWAGGAERVWAGGTGPGGGEPGVVYAGGGKLIYAPGTGPGGQGGVVIGGGEMKFAPETSGGGTSQPNINSTEVKTGGDANTGSGTTPNGGSQDYAPGTTSGGESGIAP